MEGGNRLNDWWVWEQVPLVPEPSGLAADHYHLFEKDLDLARSLNHNAYRFSIEWSRIEPSPGEFSEEELTHYSQVIQACRARKLEPIVTLHHFTSPFWFTKRGGWTSPESPQLFARYTRKVVERLGSRVLWWVTINEPTVLVYYGYLTGIWPPAKRSLQQALGALRNMIEAHQLAYGVIHDWAELEKWLVPHVGLAHHLRGYHPCRQRSVMDRLCAYFRHELGNQWTMKKCRGTMDFIGVNYYTRDFVRWSAWNPMQFFLGRACLPGHHPSAGPRSGMDWEIYPEGLWWVLMELKKYRLPILITENGVCSEDDNVRWDFIRSHLREMCKAMTDGAQVVGYLYWSLIDNFEWAHGFSPRFGLIEVDYATQERHVRPSALRLAEVIRTRKLTSEKAETKAVPSAK